MADKRVDLDQLDGALRSAFPGWDELSRMLLLKLGWNLGDIAGQGPLRTVVPNMLMYTEARSLTGALVEAAFAENPTNSKLRRFREEYFSLSSAAPSALEKITRQHLGFASFEEIVRRQGEILRCVCRVDIDGQGAGTGFLVGPRVVLTNYHVVAGHDDSPLDPSVIQCRFDFTGGGPGIVHRLSSNGVVAHSPWSDSDDEDDPKPDAGADELDYALLELDRRIGEERGTISLGDGAAAFVPGAPLFIVQHPSGRPLQVALDTEAIVRVNASRTRVRYRTNTLPGSSGSPCFDGRWQLVALHHSGDPRLHRHGRAFGRYNEGIPIDRVRESLHEAGVSPLLAR